MALSDDGSWHYEQIIHGESVARVLGYLQFHRDVLVDRIERQVQSAVGARRMTAREGKAFREFYAGGLEGLTYLEPGRPLTGVSASGRQIGGRLRGQR